MIEHTKINGSLMMALVVCAFLPGCSDETDTAETISLPDAAFVPLAGGQVQRAGNYTLELAPTPEGRLEAHLRDAQGQPVTPEGVTLSAEIEDEGELRTIALLPDETQPRYVGIVPGVSGRRPVTVVLGSNDGNTPEVVAIFPEVELTTTTVDAQPWHNGNVTFVGENRVEVATTSQGQVTVSVTDLDGRPVPPQSVELDEITFVGPEGPRVVPLQPQGLVFVGDFGAPPPPQIQASVDVRIRGHHYPGVHIRHVHPLAPGIAVEVSHRPLAPVVISGPWGPPAPPIVDVHVGHPGKGWGKGHWRVHHGKGWGKGHWGGHRGKGWGKGHWGGHRGKGHWGGHRGKGHGGHRWAKGHGRGKR